LLCPLCLHVSLSLPQTRYLLVDAVDAVDAAGSEESWCITIAVLGDSF